MAIQNEAWFIHAVSDTVTQLSQQKRSKVTGAVRLKSGVVGKTEPFQRLSSLDMNEVTIRDGDTQYLNPTQSKRRAVLRDFIAAVLIDTFDELKMLANPESEFAQMLAYAQNRKLDDLVIGVASTGNGGAIGNVTTVDEAAETTSQTVIPAAQQLANGGTGLTLTKILDTKQLLDAADVDEEDRYFFYAPKGLRRLLDDTKVTSADYNTVKALAAGGFAMDETWMGFKWRMSTRLPKTGNIRSCIAFQKLAVGLAVGTVKGIEMDKAVHKNNAMQALVKLSAGAARIDDVGVVQVDIDETA